MLPAKSYHSVFIKMCLVLVLVGGLSLAARAQPVDDENAAIQELILEGYRAYVKKDAAQLFSLFSKQSPYLPEFESFINQEFSLNERVKIQGGRVLLVRRLEIEGDRATARLFVELHAVNMDTGKPAEGFGEMDHLLRFVKEGGVWKMWQFVSTAKELADALLAATTDEERAVVLATKGTPFTGGLLNGLLYQAQTLLDEKGDYGQATALYKIALQVAKQLNQPLGVGGALVGLGDVHTAQGDYLRAADNYQKALKLAKESDSKGGLAYVSVKMGNIHYQQGNFAQAMEHYQRSMKVYEELGSTQEIAYPLLNVGNAYFSQGDYAQALEYYQRSLKICEQTFYKVGIAYLLNKIADVYAAQGKSAEAVERYQKSLTLHEELGNKALMAYSLNHFGDVRYAQGMYTEAAALSARAVELARANNSPEILWQALTSNGRASRALNEHGRAHEAFSDAIAVIEQLRHQIAGNEQDQQLFFESKTAPYSAMVDLLVAQNRWAEAFAYAERAKGRVLLDVLGSGRENITGAMTSDERNQEKRLNEVIVVLNSQLRREHLRAQADETRVANIEAQLKKARLEYEAFQTQIYAAHPELKIQRGQVEPLTLDGVASLVLDTKTALLEFSVAREKVYLFVITKSTGATGGNGSDVELKVYPLDFKAGELATLAGEFRNRLGNNSLDFREPARRLYDLLIRPAQSQLDGKTTLCIVPDGSLWELPFQALQSGENKYLLEDYALFYVPSLNVLREIKKRDSRPASPERAGGANAPGASIIKVSDNLPSAQRTLLAFGNPALSSTVVAQARSFNRGESFGSLPEAEREVKSLTQFYSPAESMILTGNKAREETVKAEAKKYRILHFATHGTLDDYNPMYSRLMLASTSADEDGFLEAREIINLDLNAELVVLSACQTARGRVGAGEGLIGMTWAFFVAGTPTTVASQWKVDAASTTLLMTNFHRLLSAQQSNGGARLNKAEALREAALTLMANSKYRHPFYWAGFVVVGDGNRLRKATL